MFYFYNKQSKSAYKSNTNTTIAGYNKVSAEEYRKLSNEFEEARLQITQSNIDKLIKNKTTGTGVSEGDKNV